MPQALPANHDELIALLESGQDAAIVGLHESTWFDAKSSAYQLDNPKHVWELAKDVSAMANVGGGVILIGAATEQAEGSLVEFVSDVRPIPVGHLMAADRVHAILASNLWPPLGNRVAVRQFERAGCAALQAIVIEPAADDTKPVLVRTKATIEVDGKTHEVESWGSARRVGSGTEWEPVPQLWADIRDGRIARRNLTLLATPGPGRVEERVADAISALAERTDAGDHAALALVAYPDRPIVLPGFNRSDGLRGALEHLPDRAIRRDGFGLGYGLDVDSLDGGLAVIEPNRRALLVQRDGLVVAIALGTPEMLGWAHQGRQPDDPLRINQHVLVEWPLEFARFVDREIRLGSPGSWTYQVRGLRLKSGTPRLVLSSLSSFPYGWERPAAADNPEESIDATGVPERDALTLIREVAGWFGIDELKHPWIQNDTIVVGDPT